MKKRIADCFWPEAENGTYVSHEAICILNDDREDHDVKITLYFENHDPISGFQITVPAERTRHIRMDQIVNKKGVRVPQNTPYAAVIESEADMAVQYTRVDTTNEKLALMTTIV